MASNVQRFTNGVQSGAIHKWRPKCSDSQMVSKVQRFTNGDQSAAIHKWRLKCSESHMTNISQSAAIYKWRLKCSDSQLENNPANTSHSPNVVLMLGQGRRQWTAMLN